MRGEPFGVVLRRIIDAEFGSQEAFAQALGKSAAWVNQLVSGAAASVTYPTVRSLMDAVRSSVMRDELYEAWRSTFAPAPAELPTKAELTEEGIAPFVEGAPHTASMGSIVAMYREAIRLWTGVRSMPDRIDLVFAVGRVVCELCFALGRRGQGLRLAGELEARCREAQYPFGVAHALWLQGLAKQELLRGTSDELYATHKPLRQYLALWRPESEKDRTAHFHLEQSLTRDSGTLAFNLLMAGKGDEAFVQSRLAELQKMNASLSEAVGVSLGKTTEAKLQAALGETDLAWDALTAAAKALPQKSPNDQARFLVQEIRLYLQDRDLPRATRSLSTLHDLTEEHSLLHYKARALELEQALARLS